VAPPQVLLTQARSPLFFHPFPILSPFTRPYMQYRTSYTLNLRVTDVGGLTDSLNVVITVINVNEAPVIVRGQSFVASEAWSRDTLVGLIQASDPDAST
jgi:hypothetical protein